MKNATLSSLAKDLLKLAKKSIGDSSKKEVVIIEEKIVERKLIT